MKQVNATTTILQKHTKYNLLMHIFSLKQISYITIASVLFLQSCINQKANDHNALSTTHKSTFPAIDTANIDKTINPTEDFFQYVNGNWIKNNPIPSSESAWGNFNEINERNQKNLREILDNLTTENNEKGSIKQKLADYYYTAIDTATLDKQGFSPILDELKKIESIQNLDDLSSITGELNMKGMNPFFNFGITVDQKNSSRYISGLYQGGIGLPDKDYYTNKDEKNESIRVEYKKYIQTLFELVNTPTEEAKIIAEKIFDFETALASKSRSRVQLRDAEANYNLKKVQDIKTLYPSINWNNFLSALTLNDIKDISVGQPEFFQNLNNLVKTTPIKDLAIYLKYNLIRNASSKLSKPFVDATFAFYGTKLNGIKNQRPRWKTAVEAVDNGLGEALGQLYVEKYFTAESKRKVNEMIDNLTAVYKERIGNLTWMSDSTKKQALVKLSTIIRKIGYPDKWMDYSTLEITRDAYIKNVYAANVFDAKYQIARINQPVDKTEWQMTPSTVNAYYDPTINEIVFPAGIMQPPFFNPDADDAVNYGSMGAVIGHELTHGFDDEGSHYDAYGNLKEWWTADDRKKFSERTNILVEQFNGYSPIDTMHVNGMLTLGENIADLGGLTLSYYALKKSFEGKPAPERIDGFTAEQRFFLSWAQAWRNSMRDEALRNMIVTNPHSPAQYRVNGPLANMKEFYDAFGVKEGDKLFKPETARAIIW
ncbi:MAG: M13 family metallopeptidase [Bacteroidetes bacterium]|nr:M13 family metallopeptidase [Bacteroidota bacterium]